MMTYDEYRKIGHGAFVSFTLSVHPMIWYGTAAVVGAILGLSL